MVSDFRFFYKKIGAKGLEQLAKEYKVNDDIDFVRKHAKKSDHILDLACGYGRVSLPLAKAGYVAITGIDFSPNLIREARKRARALKVKIIFDVGTMTSLPYENESFDRVFCLWNSFNLLMKRHDQLKALKEVRRVLKSRGKAFFVLYDGDNLDIQKKIKDGSMKREAPFLESTLQGITTRMFVYTREIIKERLASIPFKRTSLVRTHLNARRRFLLTLEK